MKFTVGDRILLKRSGEEGFVVRFLSKTMMEVDVKGTLFPVYTEEVDHPYLKWFTEKKAHPVKKEPEIPVEKTASRSVRLAQGIYLSFIPQFRENTEDDIIELFRIHLLNETAEAIQFHYLVRNSKGNTFFQHRGGLHAFGNIYLHPIELELLNEQPRFHWEVQHTKPPIMAAKGLLRIRPAQLANYIHEMLEQNQASFSVRLTQVLSPIEVAPTLPSIQKMPTLGLHGLKDLNTRVHLETKAAPVVDLHIKAILGADGSLKPEEILQIQMNFLHQKLDAALAAGLPSMLIIHGLGKGSLRKRVHELLAASANIDSYSNHWISGYGWGATEVIFHH